MTAHHKTLREIKKDWRKRLRECGLTVRQFCDTYGVSYNSWNQNNNPTLKWITDVDAAISQAEGDNV